MTFYEELGVPPDAPLETIRDAYRNAARLIHPDVQTDPALKESAEAQMKRVNHLYGILSDPARRRRYDQELAEAAVAPAPTFIPPPLPADPFEHVINGNLVWLAATAVCAAFILWLAAHESSSSPAVYPPAASSRQESGARMPASTAPSHRTVSLAGAASAQPTADPQRDDELQTLRGQLLVANADRDLLEKHVAARGAGRKVANLELLSPDPLVAPAAAPEISLPTVLPPAAPPRVPAVRARWSGSWAYLPIPLETRSLALLPPEFIEAIITEEEGRIRGQYHARFKVANAGISPDVDFRFEGKVSGPAGRLLWTGAGGAKGEVQLRLVSDTSLEIVWSATDLGKQMGLASGTAVLTRKN